MTKTIIIFILLIFLFILYLKYFEKTHIFYPDKKIYQEPKDFNLNYKEVFIKTPDNINLCGWFIKGDSKSIILYFHGNAGNISTRLEIVKMFVDSKFNVFIFDYRGYGKSTGKPTEKGIYLDTLSIYKYLTENENINIENIIVYGESIGCAFATYLAEKEKVSLLILQSPFSSALDMASFLFPYIPKFFLKLIISVEFDNLSRIKKINIPKLIIHSIDDEIVPFKFAQKLFIQASHPKEFLTTRGLHNQTIYNNKDEYIKKINEFIERYKDYRN